MERQQLYGETAINSAHRILLVSVAVFLLTLYSDKPSLAVVSQVFLVATLFTLSLVWYWCTNSLIAYCLTLVPALIIGSLLNQMSLLQYLALIFAILGLYLWGLKAYLLMLLAEVDKV